MNVTPKYCLQAVNPLQASRVHLVRHCRGANLASGKSFGYHLAAGHQAQRLRQAGDAGAELIQTTDHLEVDAARINLTNGIQPLVNAKVGKKLGIQLLVSLGVSFQQRQLIQSRPHSSTKTAQRISLEKVFEPAEGMQHFFPEHGQPLAEGRRLRSCVVGATNNHQLVPLMGTLTQGMKRGDVLQLQIAKRFEDLPLLYVVSQVATGHALVNEFVTGQTAELLDAGFDVVFEPGFAGQNGCQIHPIDDSFIVVDRFLGEFRCLAVSGLSGLRSTSVSRARRGFDRTR